MPSKTMNVPFIKGDSKGRVGTTTDYRDTLNVNILAVTSEHLGTPYYLRTQPGLKAFGEAPSIDRAAIWNSRTNGHFRVSGAQLVEVDETGAVTVLGSIPGGDEVSMAYSFNNLAIVAARRFYLYNPTAGVRQVRDADVGRPIDVTWVDGYFFFTDGSNVYHTLITNEEQIDPLQFSTAEFSPDETLAVLRDQNNQVLVMGRFSVEYFTNRATANFAFSRIPQKALSVGVVGTHAKIDLDGQVYIVGGAENGITSVYLLGAGTQQTVASREIERILALYTEEELRLTRMEERGVSSALQFLIHLPNHVLVFNQTLAAQVGPMQAWSLLESGNGNIYQAIHGVYDLRITQWVYGNKRDGRLATLDDSSPAQYGEIGRGAFYSPLFRLEAQSVDAIELYTVPGISTITSSVGVSTTENGITYTEPHFFVDSEAYDYRQRYIVRALGYVRDTLGFKFTTGSHAMQVFSTLAVTYG